MHLLFCSRSFTTGVWICPDIPRLFLDAASGPPALIGTFTAEHCFLMIFSAAPCLLWNRKCSTWRSPSWSLRWIALQLTAFPVQSKSFWNRGRCSGSHFCDEAHADFTQLLCLIAAHPCQTPFTTKVKFQPNDNTLNLSCNSIAHSWILEILMSFWWPHRSSSTATQFHCQPRAHQLPPTFISLKLLPQCPVFIDLSEQPFGLSHGLVIGHRPPPTTAGGWVYLAADMPPTWHPLCFGLICWTPKETTFFNTNNKMQQYGAFMGHILFNMQ